MPGHKRKRHAHRRLADANDDPLKSIQRDDGLWESIEHDRETLWDSENDTNPPPVKHQQELVLAAKEKDLRDTRRSATLPNIQLNSTGTQTSPAVPATDTCTFPAAKQPTSSPAPAATLEPLTVRRRRGRPPKNKANEPPTEKVGEPPPKKSRTNEPSVHRRHVRFTDPDPSDCGRSRASHVFVRLHKVLVSLGSDLQPGTPSRATSSPRQVEFVWNNRAKAWKLSGDRGSEGMVELHGLLEQPPEQLGIVRPFVSPVEKNGVRQPVTFSWDAATFSFQGLNQDNEVICITLGEMRDMARDPWGRQYVGYIMG